MHSDVDDRIAQKIEGSITRVSKVIFPTSTNHHDTLFGGIALAWMDEVSFITATRFSRKRLVTVSTEKINFTHPIPSGTIVESVVLAGRVSRSMYRYFLKICIAMVEKK